MKRTLQHRWNRLFRRRGGLPMAARVPGANYDRQYQGGSFGRPRAGRHEVSAHWQRWLWRAVKVAAGVGALWVLWQSWIGLGIVGN